MSSFLASFLERITFLTLGVVQILKLMGMSVCPKTGKESPTTTPEERDKRFLYD